jgi:hypothetical protein
MIPLFGQGKPLPPDCPYEGQWLIEDHMFLYRPRNQTTLGGSGTEMTAGFQKPDGKWCFGFNSMALAWELRVGSEEIFEHNKRKTLILENVGPIPAEHGGTAAKVYIFRVGDQTARVVIEAGPEGTA